MKVIVIGGGIVGSSVAYHLSKTGVEVVVIDRRHQGQATAAGAGIVCPWLSSREDPNWYRLAKAGATYYPTLISELERVGETDVGFGLVGAISVSDNPNDLDVIEERVRRRKRNTPEVGEISRLSSKEARQLFPPLRENLEAVHVTGGARVDGRLLSKALRHAAEKQGATFIHGEAHLGRDNHEQLRGVYVEERFIAADAVVVAAGAWTNDLLQDVDVKLPVAPQKGQIIHLELPGVNTDDWPVVLPQSSHYLLAFEKSRVVVGATRETGSGFDYRLTAGGLHEVLREALAVAPGLANATTIEKRIGFRPMGDEAIPYIGRVPQVPGLVIANGLGASGLTMGPYVGKLAAQLTLGEEVELDLTPYEPERASKVE